MKVFISHKNTDSLQAFLILRELERNGVKAYLDVLDDNIINDGKELTDHIKKQLNSCTDIIVLISEETKASWWVPFEIGMSAQIDMPTVSFLKENVELPSYLSYWPRLKSLEDISKYVTTRKRIEKIIMERYQSYELSSLRKIEVPMFYNELKRELR